MVMNPDVHYLGIAVLYHDIDRARWRRLAPIAPSGVTKLVALLGRRQVTLETV
jgi:type VI secretion system VasD/TssJ family lipoprotein